MFFQRLSGQPFRLAEGIDIRRIDEIDAGRQRAANDLIDFALLQAADRLPHAGIFIAAEGHRAEADFRHEKAGVSQLLVLHGILHGSWPTRPVFRMGPRGCCGWGERQDGPGA